MHTCHFIFYNRPDGTSFFVQIALLWLVTAPWLARHRFPVHSFSNNWTQQVEAEKTVIENLMYRVKKWQYVFYKHVILHGLNISVCVTKNASFLSDQAWRIFWVSLNAAYVMEFFLQSLVKRKVLQNSTMLLMNTWLMLASSMAATQAVFANRSIRWEIALLSLTLNFTNRHHDVSNTMVVAGGTILYDTTLRLQPGA